LTMPKVKGKPGTLPLLAGTETEVEAYGFIRQQLKDLGWIVRDPSKIATGQVWTQNQCLAHAHIKAALGNTRPENIIKLSENTLWIIEAKASRKHLAKAIDEAVNYYALPINNLPGQTRAFLATGVAGSEELGYLIRTKAFIGGQWKDVTINSQIATGLLSPQQAATLLHDQVSDVHDFAPPVAVFNCRRTDQWSPTHRRHQQERSGQDYGRLAALGDRRTAQLGDQTPGSDWRD